MANNVSTGKPKVGGAIFRAPLSSTLVLPESASATLATDFKALGYVSEDGLVNGNAIDSVKIKAWGGDVVAAVQTGKEDTFQFTLIESLNKNVLKTVYGDDNVDVTEATSSTPEKIAVSVANTVLPASAWVVDLVLANDKIKRIVIPNATITEIGDITYKDDSVIGYALTITASLDEDDFTHYEYIE